MRRSTAITVGLMAAESALAQSGPGNQGALEEVVVTAQHREQKLQDTAISLSVVNGELIERHNMLWLTDIARAVPGVTLENGGSGAGKSAVAFIRGVGQFDYNYTVEPGVGIYIDDVYHSTLFGTELDLLDLERVEVLRGPQGTLFGKNSIGGAMRLISRRPRGDSTARIDLSAGNYDRRELRGMFDVPLISKVLLLRVAAAHRERDGHVDQIDFACAHPDLGGDVNQGAPLLPLLQSQSPDGSDCKLSSFGNENVTSTRAALRWIPGNAVEINFVVDWTGDNARAGAQSLIAVNADAQDPRNVQASPFGGFNGNVAVPLYGIAYDARFLTGSPYRSFASFNNLVHVGPGRFPSTAVTGITSSPNANTLEAYGISATMEWKIAPALQFESITAWRGYTGEFSDDVDASPINQTLQSNQLDHRQFSQEIRLHGAALAGRVDWTAGVFYFDGESLNRGPVSLSALSWFVPPLDFTQDDSSNVRNRSVFADGTWHATERLNVAAGLRYTQEEKDYTFRHLSFVPEVPSLVPPTRTDVSYGRGNPRFVVDYRWRPELMTYVSFATGFRAGGFNPRPFNSAQVTPFGPEGLASYEIGIKSEWLDRRVRLNTAVFFSDYRDLQLNILTIDSTGEPYSAPANVGRAHIVGGEVELQAQPIPTLTLSASFGFNELEATELGSAINCDDVADPVPAPAPGNNCTIDGASLGKPLPLIPRKTASASAGYRVPLRNASSLALAAHMSYQSVTYTDALASTAGTVPSRVLLDGRITWEPGTHGWAVTLSGTNLTNREYYINKRNLYGLWGMVLGQPGRPREWALTVTRRFE